MKIRFFYKDISQHMKTNDPEISTIGFKTKLLDSSAHVKKSYETYLLCALDFDLFENKSGECDELLEIIERIENGLEETHVYYGQGFDHYIYKHSVIFEHAIFGVCPTGRSGLARYRITKSLYRECETFSCYPNR